MVAKKLLKNPWVAALLNFFVPGLGYLYVGRGKRTWFSLGLTISSILVIAYGVKTGSATLPSFAFTGSLVAMLAFAWDAYKDALELR